MEIVKKYYTQNQEEKHIVDFFKGSRGTLLSIGENDGKTFSNALRLIELGWKAVLVEPSPQAFKKLKSLHEGTQHDVICVRAAVGKANGKLTLHESGAHLPDQSDVSLLSTLEASEKTKWKGVKFNEVQVDVIDYKTLQGLIGIQYFDFISIDAEGLDLDILKQIDLFKTKLLCIEWNENKEVKKEIITYTSTFGMNNIIYQTGENLLITR